MLVIVYSHYKSRRLTPLTGNELRKDLRKWIAPPDPSVNYNVASGAHHEGTATWCTKGTTLADWKSSGTLLWIHGKRRCSISFQVLFVTDYSWIDSWLGEEYLKVCCHSVATCFNRTYRIDKLRAHPGRRIHIQRRLGFLGLLLLRFQEHRKTGLPCFIIISSCPTFRPIRFILRHSFLLILRTQTRIATTDRRFAITVP